MKQLLSRRSTSAENKFNYGLDALALVTDPELKTVSWDAREPIVDGERGADAVAASASSDYTPLPAESG